MNHPALLLPTGAKATVTSGSTQSTRTEDGAGGFEHLLLGLAAPGLAAPQGTSPSASGAAGAVGLLASTTATQSGVVQVKAGGTALTGAAVLGIEGMLPAVASGQPFPAKTALRTTPSPIGGNVGPVTATLAGVKSPNGLGAAATAAVGTTAVGTTAVGMPAIGTTAIGTTAIGTTAVGTTAIGTTAIGTAAAGTTGAGRTGIQAASKPGSAPASLKGQPATSASTTRSQTLSGSSKQQGAAAAAGGSAVTEVLSGKTATPQEVAKKPAPLAGGASKVVAARETIKSAVIDAPGAGKKTVKPMAKTAGSHAKGSKTGGSARSASQVQNRLTVAQAAQAGQAAANANAARSELPSGRVRTTDLFVPAPTSAVATGGESGTIVLVSSVAASSGAELAAHTAAARTGGTFTPIPQQVAVQFSQALAQGADRISIQLQPASLGRVEVEIKLTKDGKLSAAFIADRPDTLDMLQRDARALERALNDAGMRTDTGGLSFSLRGGSGHAQQFNSSPGGSGGGRFFGIETEALLTPRGPILNANALLDIQV